MNQHIVEECPSCGESTSAFFCDRDREGVLVNPCGCIVDLEDVIQGKVIEDDERE